MRIEPISCETVASKFSWAAVLFCSPFRNIGELHDLCGAKHTPLIAPARFVSS